MNGWYRSVPSHWHRGRVKSVAERVTDGAHISPDTENGLYDFVSTRDVKGGTINFAGSLKTSQETYDYMVKTGCRPGRGDVLFSKDGTVGETAIVTEERDFVVASSLVIITPRLSVMTPSYLTYMFASRPAQEQAASFMRGAGLPRLSVGNLARLELLVPPLDEQRAIADYLDRETARIDTLIEEQQRLIEMLRERRRAVAMHAILQPTVTGSATDKLGRTARIGNGSTPRRDSTIYWAGGDVPWLNSSVVNESRVIRAKQFVTAVALRECHLPVVASGSILVGLTGQGKTRGMATILDIEATVNQHVAYVTPDRSRWLPEYLLWSLIAAYDELRRLSEENGSTKGGLTCEALKQFRLAMPPLGEQRRIAAYLDEQTAKIDTLIVETERFIELARERRAALITAAVTGQIEVREMA